MTDKTKTDVLARVSNALTTELGEIGSVQSARTENSVVITIEIDGQKFAITVEKVEDRLKN